MVAVRLVDVRKDYGRLEERLPRFVVPGGAHLGVGPLSLELERGRALAVVGANGAGKSTLLRLVGGLSVPTSGVVERSGTFGRLLDLGAGFLEDCTGRENARIALALGGAGRDTALARAEEFSGLGAFLDEPVRTYSLGMRLRLAYALVVAEAPDVLVVDEVLAVGDEAFQRRCMAYMEGFLAEGHTLVLATHNLYVAEKVCDRALWLENGSVKSLGPASEVVRGYRDSLARRLAGRPEPVSPSDAPPALAGRIRSTPEVVEHGGPWCIEVDWAQTASGRIEIRSATDALVSSVPVRGPGRVEIPRCPLLPGGYTVSLVGRDSRHPVAEAVARVRGDARELGIVALRHDWQPPGARP